MINKNEIIRIKKKLDSLQELKYDTIMQRIPQDPDNPDIAEEQLREMYAGNSAEYEYLSRDKKIHVNEHSSWYDCAGGGSDEIITYSLSIR